MSDRIVVFMSHIAEEAGLARILKKHLEKAFLGMVKIFVSSDGQSIVAGDPWLNKIDDALQHASLTLILCSERSIRRPWINFEAGASWVRKIPIIPICHTDLRPRNLPPPLSTLQAVEVSRESGLKQIGQRLAELIGCNQPSVDYNAILNEIEAFEQSYKGIPEIDRTAQAAQFSELKSLKREAMAALRRDPKDIELFEQKLHEIDLVEGLPRGIKVETLNELGLEVTLNSDQGTRLLLQHLLWQIAPTDWPSLSFAEEILGDLETGRHLLETISSILWTWGVQTVEYRRGKEIIQEITKAILEIHGKAVLIRAGQAQKDCKSALHAMVQKAKAENRHDVIDLLDSSIKE